MNSMQLTHSQQQIERWQLNVRGNLVPQDNKNEYQFSAILGDLHHREDVYIALQSFNSREALLLISGKSQAYYLQLHHPELVPETPPDGNKPSVHTLSTIFEFHYYKDVWFKTEYLRTLNNGDFSEFNPDQ